MTPTQVRTFLGNQGFEVDDYHGVITSRPSPAKPIGSKAVATDPHQLPPPAAVGTRTDRDRLDELERKLDRVLKALETLKEDGGSGQLKGDSALGRPLRQ